MSDDRAGARRRRSVAALARLVRHDLNNQLHVILGNADLLRRDVAGEAALRRIERITTAGGQVGATTGALLALAAPSEEPAIPTLVLTELAPLLRLLLEGPDRLRVEPGWGRWAVGCSRAALEDMLLELAELIAAAGAQAGLGIKVREVAGPPERVEITLVLDAPGAALALLDPLALLAGGAVAPAPGGLVLALPRIAD